MFVECRAKGVQEATRQRCCMGGNPRYFPGQWGAVHNSRTSCQMDKSSDPIQVLYFKEKTDKVNWKFYKAMLFIKAAEDLQSTDSVCNIVSNNPSISSSFFNFSLFKIKMRCILLIILCLLYLSCL